MFATVSFALSDLPDTKHSVGFADFEFLANRPYFATADALYCLDYEYAVSKLESGALWRVLRKVPEKKKGAYLGFWGNVFEDYIAWLFEIYSNGQINLFYDSPSYEHEDKPICDAIVVCGTTAVLIEAKLGTCRAHVAMRATLKRCKNTSKTSWWLAPTGRWELLNFSPQSRILRRDRRNEYRQFHGVTKIIPLIIAKDDIASCWVINNYLNRRFQEKLKAGCKASHEITSLVSMSVSNLNG